MADNSGSGSPSLGEMIAANHEAANAAAAAAVSKEVSPDPIIPTSANEAAARLSAVKADPKWRDEYLAGNPRHARELRDLQAAVDKEKNTRVEMAVAGQLFDGIQPSGHLAAVGGAQYLRNLGLADAEIRQGITGSPVSSEEHAAAVAAKSRLMEDPDVVAKYMSGDAEVRRTFTRLNMIITSGKKVA
ncbi:hypothetical protein [Bradyrhizobium sp. RT7b]|uniref:hypothetical protein n=1 Tax=unclassified Bradyrhizobium TaxID=2631580 RepID=UPI0033981F13